MHLKQHLLSLNCLCCGSWSLSENLYCSRCYNQRIRHYVEHHRDNKNPMVLRPSHIYLIEWHPQRAKLFDQLVYRLKSNNAVAALMFYADLLADLVQSTVKTTQFEALVPIAGSKSSSVHAHLLAQRLALHFGLPVLDVLIKQPAQTAQKHMTAQERREQNLFSLKEKPYVEFTKTRLISPTRPLRFLLVDDVLTTGLSFQHCESVLTGSEQNMIATLFYRPRIEVRSLAG